MAKARLVEIEVGKMQMQIKTLGHDILQPIDKKRPAIDIDRRLGVIPTRSVIAGRLIGMKPIKFSRWPTSRAHARNAG